MFINLYSFLLVILLTIIAIIYGSNNWIKVVETKVEIPNLPTHLKGLRILHITDWHNNSTTKSKFNMSKVLKNKEFDLVAITGDIVDSSPMQIVPLIPNLTYLVHRAPTFFVAGNHDWYRNGENLFEHLNDAGVVVIENKNGIFEIGNRTLQIIGISDYFTGRADIDLSFSDANEEFSLVLTHDPAIFRNIAKKGPSLVLAGHTHGGQLRLPFFPTLYAPGQGFFPEFGSGLYQFDDNNLYVSKGIGYTGLFPFRFWNRPQIDLLTLVIEQFYL